MAYKKSCALPARQRSGDLLLSAADSASPPGLSVRGDVRYVCRLDLGQLSDGSGFGGFTGGKKNDERCNTDFEAGVLIALAASRAANGVAEIVCDGELEPISRAICFAAAAIAKAAIIASETLNDQCSFQDSLVDAAEIEATFEYSKIIHGNLTEHDAAISQQVMTHDTDVKQQISTHDTDVKALLANIQAGVSANGMKLDTLLARQLEVIRLLHTPNGQRSTDVPACNGGPCTWNPK